MKPSSIRLNKFISESGMCSRREADEHIEKGRVFINKKKAVIGDQVHVGDKVVVNGIALEPRKGDDIIFIALNKPVGIESTTDEEVPDNIIRFVNHSKRIFPIGRLDKDSQGLIFLTNNGDLVNKILRAGNHHEKEYIVTVNKPLTQTVISSMANGVPMLGIMTKKCKVELITPNTFRIILIQGLNRQIRRMCEHYGYEVIKLERIRIMNIGLKGLPIGDWRDLTKSEMEIIDKLLSTSSADSKKKIMPTSSKKNAYPPKHKSTAKSHKSSNASKFSQGKKTVRRGKK
jgi:23S rRNA pseudouridine2604 synthase